MTSIRIHSIQTFPASNLNRDDTGAPKSQMFGGSRRLRVSSQCKKSAVRDYFRTKDAERLSSIRTFSSPQLVADRAMELDPSADVSKVRDLIAGALKLKVKKGDTDSPLLTDALFSVSKLQVEEAAKLTVAELNERSKTYKNDFLAALSSFTSVDQKLFGRFYASDSSLTIDAAAQVAHALGTCPMPEGQDYFTGRDELGGINKRDEEGSAGNGAGHVGVKEFSSGPLYFHSSVDVDSLLEGLSGDADLTVNAMVEYIDAFVNSVPRGSQNSCAADTRATTVLVELFDDASGSSFAGAFERPAHTADEASSRLVSYASRVHKGYGTTPHSAWLFTLSDAVSAPEWVTAVSEHREIMEGVRKALSDRLGAA